MQRMVAAVLIAALTAELFDGCCHDTHMDVPGHHENALFLCPCADEAQNLLLPRSREFKDLDQASMGSARLLLKKLTCYSAEKCMVAVTGSSMAFLWMQLGLTPTNGVSSVSHLKVVRLPASHDEAARKYVLHNLLQQCSPDIQKGEQLSLIS
jgi:hypothetical protein